MDSKISSQQKLFLDSLPEKIPPKIRKAFIQIPRHQFITRYRLQNDFRWHHINSKSLSRHLPILYSDQPLVIWGSRLDFAKPLGVRSISTISGPSFVLHVLQLLKLKVGHSVYEVGTGSAWNASLIAHLVGKNGHVITSEIVKDLAVTARRRLKQLRFHNIKVLRGDGSTIVSSGEKFDRMVYTASAFSFSPSLFLLLKDGGLVVFILRLKNGIQYLQLLQKFRNELRPIYNERCQFVPLVTKDSASDPVLPLFKVLRMHKINSKLIKKIPIDWFLTGNSYSIYAPILNFLAIHDEFSVIRYRNRLTACWIDSLSKSVILILPTHVHIFGNLTALEELNKKIFFWIKNGMTSPGDVRHIYQEKANALQKII